MRGAADRVLIAIAQEVRGGDIIEMPEDIMVLAFNELRRSWSDSPRSHSVWPRNCL